MKRTAHLGVTWADKFGQPPKTPEQRARDIQRVQEILEHIGYGHLFHPEQHFYDLDLEVGSKAFTILVEELQKDPHLAPSSIGVWKDYTRQELESAELLIWGPTNQAIEDDYYTLHFKDGQAKGIAPYMRTCEACRTPLEQVRDMWVNIQKMRKWDISMSYAYFEVILSAHLARMLQESRLTGFTLRPVWSYRKPYQGEPRLFQLVVTNVLPPMASPPTEFENIQHCEVCGRRSQYLKHTHWWGKIQYREDTPIYYPRRVLEEAKDFNRTAEYFGDLAVAAPYVIISQRVYRLLREQKVKGWAAVPVYLVD